MVDWQLIPLRCGRYNDAIWFCLVLQALLWHLHIIPGVVVGIFIAFSPPPPLPLFVRHGPHFSSRLSVKNDTFRYGIHALPLRYFSLVLLYPLWLLSIRLCVFWGRGFFFLFIGNPIVCPLSFYLLIFNSTERRSHSRLRNDYEGCTLSHNDPLLQLQDPSHFD